MKSFPIVIMIIQGSIIGFILVRILMGFSHKKRENSNFRAAQSAVEIIISGIMTICIIFNEEIQLIDKSPGYYSFIFISGIGMLFFWISKSNYFRTSKQRLIIRTFCCLLIWMSVVAVLKTFIAYPYCLIPGFGILIPTSGFVLLISISHVIFHDRASKPAIPLTASLIMIITYTVLHDLLTEGEWILTQFWINLEPGHSFRFIESFF